MTVVTFVFVDNLSYKYLDTFLFILLLMDIFHLNMINKHIIYKNNVAW